MSGASQSILDLIGQTPVVELRRLSPPSGALVCLKLEHLNPTGSLKDRVAKVALEQAFHDGILEVGSTLVEASWGNSVISLALMAATRKLKITAVLPDSASLERRALLRAFGVKVVLTPGEEGLVGAVAKADELLAQTPGAVSLRLHQGEVALDVHSKTTAVELAATVKADGAERLSFVMGVGSGATLTAVGRVLKRDFPDTRVVAVEPERSRTLSLGPAAAGLHRLEELGGEPHPLAKTPPVYDEVAQVSDEAAWEMKKRLGKEEGLLVGISTGANVVAALEEAQRLGAGGRVYTLACDSGEREFSYQEQFT